METLIINQDGHVFKSKPRTKQRKLPNGNWEAYVDGIEIYGCPLCRITFFKDTGRDNPVLTMLRSSFNLVEI